jgi:peptidoglycan hydrolase-like protein with peptidoglycan-binding domain
MAAVSTAARRGRRVSAMFCRSTGDGELGMNSGNEVETQGANMALQSTLFSDDHALQSCLVDDRAHVTLGASGPHVTKIHSALIVLDNSEIELRELREGRYGASTAAAVLAFKRKRQIVNFSYQTQADNIVGKMTIAAMDREMLVVEGRWRNETCPPDR